MRTLRNGERRGDEEECRVLHGNVCREEGREREYDALYLSSGLFSQRAKLDQAFDIEGQREDC